MRGMSTEWVASAVIGLSSLVLSLSGTLAIISFRTGEYKQRITNLEDRLSSKAELADVTSMKESLAEIKGMFVLRIRE